MDSARLGGSAGPPKWPFPRPLPATKWPRLRRRVDSWLGFTFRDGSAWTVRPVYITVLTTKTTFYDHTHTHTSFKLTPANLLPSSQPMDDGGITFVESGFAVNYPQVLSLQSLCCFLFVWKPISWTKGKRLDPLCTGHMTNSRGCNSRCDQDNRPRATRTRLEHWQVIWEDLCAQFS